MAAIQVGKKIYPSKEAVKQKIRKLVESVNLEEPLDAENHEFVHDIFKMHPESYMKQASGIDYFFVRENKRYGGKSKGFWLKRPDGKEIDFSWVEALTPKTHKQKVMYAMRGAIQDQLYQKKRTYFAVANRFRIKPRCELSFKPITFTNCDCHHIRNLYDIVDEFIQGDWDSVEIVSGSDEAKFGCCLADEEFKEKWQEYHLNNAGFVIIDRNLHQTMSKRAKYETENCRSKPEKAKN